MGSRFRNMLSVACLALILTAIGFLDTENVIGSIITLIIGFGIGSLVKSRWIAALVVLALFIAIATLSWIVIALFAGYLIGFFFSKEPAPAAPAHAE